MKNTLVGEPLAIERSDPQPRGIDLFPTKEIDVKPLPESVTASLQLKYDPVSLGEMVYYEAGKIVNTVSIYSRIGLSAVTLLIKIIGGSMESKAWWQSKTIIGGIIMFIVTILQVTGVLQSGAVDAGEVTDRVYDVIGYVAEFVGFVLILIGRIKATKTIK